MMQLQVKHEELPYGAAAVSERIGTDVLFVPTYAKTSLLRCRSKT